MANRILGVLFKKKYANGDTDTIYPKTRAQDVTTSGGTTLETIATKVNGMQDGATKVAKSSTNGNILINGAQTVVYTHPNSGATAGTYNKVTVNAQGHVTSGSNVTDWTGTVSGDVSNGTVTSSQASSRSNLASGEKLSVSMGKIRKWLADLKSLAFVDKVGTSNLDSTLTTFYNNRVTTDKVTQSTSITEAGWVADARVIRTLQNQINTLNSKATSHDSSINSLNRTNIIHVSPRSPFQNRSDDWESICYERVGFRIFAFNIKNTTQLTRNARYTVYTPGSSLTYSGNSYFPVLLLDATDNQPLTSSYHAHIMIEWVAGSQYSFDLYTGNTSIPVNTGISFVLVTLQY